MLYDKMHDYLFIFIVLEEVLALLAHKIFYNDF